MQEKHSNAWAFVSIIMNKKQVKACVDLIKQAEVDIDALLWPTRANQTISEGIDDILF